MPDEPVRGPFEGVPEVPGAAREIDITDAALADRVADDEIDELDEMDELDDVLGDEPPRAVSAEAVSGGTPQPGGPTPPAAEPSQPGGPTPVGAEMPDPAGLGSPDDTPTPRLHKILESILLVVDQPVPEVELAQVLETPRATVLAALEDLSDEYRRADRGFELRQVAGGWRLYTSPDCAPYVERFVLDGQQARLTQAALETLAVVAYRQPVSRQSIAAIRGVNVDGVIRTLLSRGLIAEAGEEGPGGAHLYVTTPYFLERLGLRSLGELPNLAPLLPAEIDDLADGV